MWFASLTNWYIFSVWYDFMNSYRLMNEKFPGRSAVGILRLQKVEIENLHREHGTFVSKYVFDDFFVVVGVIQLQESGVMLREGNR